MATLISANCICCGNPFQYEQGKFKRRLRVYCSIKCRTKIAKEKRIQTCTDKMICKNCGQDFVPIGYHVKTRVFCSMKCSRDFQGKHEKELLTFECKNCKSEIQAYKKRMFCGSECKKKYVESTPEYSEKRKCSICGEEKYLYDFGCHDEDKYIYFEKFCYKCKKEMTPTRQKDIRKIRNTMMRKNYGITHEIYDDILSDQDNRCAICNNTEDPNTKATRFNVDHCHDSGHVRGILCGRCNLGIGQLGDKSNMLLKAYNYLKKFEEEDG